MYFKRKTWQKYWKRPRKLMPIKIVGQLHFHNFLFVNYLSLSQISPKTVLCEKLYNLFLKVFSLFFRFFGSAISILRCYRRKIRSSLCCTFFGCLFMGGPTTVATSIVTPRSKTSRYSIFHFFFQHQLQSTWPMLILIVACFRFLFLIIFS